MRISLKKQEKFKLENIQLTNEIDSIESYQNTNDNLELELEYIFLLEYDVDVKFYYERPIEISLKKKKHTTFAPSYIVEYYDKKTEIIFINKKEEIELIQNKYNNEFHMINSFCKKNDFKLKFLTETDIYSNLLFNAKFLLYFRNPLIQINNGDIEILLDIVKKEQKITISHLIAKTSKVKERQAELLYTLWYCISNSFFSYNKNNKLTMDTLIQI